MPLRKVYPARVDMGAVQHILFASAQEQMSRAEGKRSRVVEYANSNDNPEI
jgi:hypothetical protein